MTCRSTTAGRDQDEDADTATVYGANAYGTGWFHQLLDTACIDSRCKTQQAVAAAGLFTRDVFGIDLDADTVTCPAGQVTSIRHNTNGGGIAYFGAACTTCPLREHHRCRWADHPHQRSRAGTRLGSRSPG